MKKRYSSLVASVPFIVFAPLAVAKEVPFGEPAFRRSARALTIGVLSLLAVLTTSGGVTFAMPSSALEHQPLPSCKPVASVVGHATTPDVAFVGTTATFEGTGGIDIIELIGFCQEVIVAFPSFKWNLTAQPQGSNSKLQDEKTLSPTLFLDVPGKYTVRFTVCPGGCTVKSGFPAQNVVIAETSSEVSISSDIFSWPAPRYPQIPDFALIPKPPIASGGEPKCVNFPREGIGKALGLMTPAWVTVNPLWAGANEYRLLEGEVVASHSAVSDFTLNHTTLDDSDPDKQHARDWNAIVIPDPQWGDLLYAPANPKEIEVEWEQPSWHEFARPAIGDRMSVFGFHVHDCGHAPFPTEIHPPIGLAVHRPRPVAIPSNQIFDFNCAQSCTKSGVGDNVVVPGIQTDIFFNSNPGDAVNCEFSRGLTALHLPYFGDCIQPPPPLGRKYEFNIYLPPNPTVVYRNAGISVPQVPLYIGGHTDSPSPTVEASHDGDVTYLHVTIDLNGYKSQTYQGYIRAAWGTRPPITGASKAGGSASTRLMRMRPTRPLAAGTGTYFCTSTTRSPSGTRSISATIASTSASRPSPPPFWVLIR